MHVGRQEGAWRVCTFKYVSIMCVCVCVCAEGGHTVYGAFGW